MAFSTKQNLSNQKFQQVTGSTLTLSGNTVIANQGSLNYFSAVTITENTQVVHKKYVDDLIQDFEAGSVIYTGATPASVQVGGLNVGTQLTGRTANDILQEILVPTLNPTLTAPSITSFSQNLSTTQEVGLSVTPTFTTNFSRGSINPQYSAASPFRSGPANAYVYSGSGNNRTVLSTGNTNTSSATGATILVEGANTWGVYVSYDAGVQPKNSAGGNFNSPLSAGNTSVSNTTITGRFLRFFGPTASNPTDSATVRALPSSALQTSNIMTFELNTGTVQTKFAVALPPGRTITSVFDLDAANANITTSYTDLGNVTVNDGGGSGTPRSYRLYVLTLGAPYSENHRHSITTA